MTTIHDEKLLAVGKRAFRIPEACFALGIGRTSLYELHQRGEIKFIRLAGRTLVPLSEIERLTTLSTAA